MADDEVDHGFGEQRAVRDAEHGSGIESWVELAASCAQLGITLEEAIDMTVGEHFRKLNDERLGENRPVPEDEFDDTYSPTDLNHLDDTYFILDEVEDQLNEAAGDVDLGRDEDLMRLVEDYRACARTRRLIKELVDPRTDDAAPTEA